jgi:hypothetical protein
MIPAFYVSMNKLLFALLSLSLIVLLIACNNQPLIDAGQSNITPTIIPEAWSAARAALPGDILIYMPISMPARFGLPKLNEVQNEEQWGPRYTIVYSTQDGHELIAFILGIGKGSWGNAPRPDTTEPITVDGANGELNFSSSVSTSGNPEFVAIWQQQGRSYQIKAISAKTTSEEIKQIIESLVTIKK